MVRPSLRQIITGKQRAASITVASWLSVRPQTVAECSLTQTGYTLSSFVPPPPCRAASLAAEPRFRFGNGELQREESKHEKLEREQREREQMRQAVAAYSGPITKCPRGKTSDQHQDFGVAQTRGVRRHPGVSRSKS
jgi:hypothetical protein